MAKALLTLMPDAQFVIQSAVGKRFFETRIPSNFVYLYGNLDPGIAMVDSLTVDRRSTRDAYLSFHKHRELHLADQMRILELVAPDVLVSDIPYLSLVAAKRLGIPTAAICSLNWADILAGYFAGDPEVETIIRELVESYQGAEVFLAPEPSMPMTWLSNKVLVGPVALLGSNRRPEIQQRLRLNEKTKIALLAFGGLDLEITVEHLPQSDNLVWLTQSTESKRRADIVAKETLGLAFSDILASADAIITKPGYGIFTEAACHGIPVVSIERPDWPETPYLVRWLRRHVAFATTSRAALENGTLSTVLEPLWGARIEPAIAPSGAGEAARMILALASGGPFAVPAPSKADERLIP